MLLLKRWNITTNYRMIKLYTGWLLFLLLCTTTIWAQEKRDSLVTVDLSHATIEQLVQALESQTAYRFYYDASQFDSIRISVSAQKQSLANVLQLAFPANSEYHFSIDQRRNVFLTRGLAIVTALPSGVFDNKKDTAGNEAIREYIAEKKRPGITASENKLHEIGIKTNTIDKGNAVLSGVIVNQKTGEPIINAAIFVDETQSGVITDQYGYYSLSLPKGRHTLHVQGMGLRDSRYQVMLYSDGKLNMELPEQVISLKEVIVSAQKVVNINRVQMGVEKLNIQTIKQVPTVFGEADVLRVVLTLPGVKTVGEASTTR